MAFLVLTPVPLPSISNGNTIDDSSNASSSTDKQATNIPTQKVKDEEQSKGLLSNSKNRKPLIISNDENTLSDNGFIRYMSEEDSETTIISPSAAEADSNSNNTKDNLNNATLIVGISGGLLAACLSNSIACTGLLLPTNNANIPDPEGAAILIESFNSIKRDESLQIDTQQLKQKAEILKRKMQEIIRNIQKQQRQQQQQSIPLEDEMQSMYM
jgi:PAC2 family